MKGFLILKKFYQSQSPSNFIRRTFAIFPKGVDILSDPDSLKCMIKRFGPKAFLVNNVYIPSSIVLFPNFYLQWRVRKIEDLTMDDLAVFKLLYPGVQIVLIGCGSKALKDRAKIAEFAKNFKHSGISLEFLSSEQAAATFNILNSEGRNVAAAVMTIQSFTEDEQNELFSDYRQYLPSRSSPPLISSEEDLMKKQDHHSDNNSQNHQIGSVQKESDERIELRK